MKILTRNISSSLNFYRSIVLSKISIISDGYLDIREIDGNSICYGKTTSKLKATITVKSNQFFKRVFWSGSLGFADSYILNEWETDNLTVLLRLLSLNLDIVDKSDNTWPNYFSRKLFKLVHFFNKNTLYGSKRNISKHYDLGNNFFQLFLDKRMMYSAAKFNNPHDTLDQAAENKLAIICEKLEIKSTDHILEIGTGWGGFAIYAAKKYKCHITTTTISQAQYDYTQKQISDLGLQKHITLLLQDYRKLQGQYDKLVSIEMIEAVGHHYLNNYFQQCNKLLKNNGLFVLQAITIEECRYHSARDSVDFIKANIFPGCCIPATGQIFKRIAQHTNLNILSIEDLTLDYAKTLQLWAEKFNSAKQEMYRQKFDEFFIRKWQYYFSYCEAAFLERKIFDLQLTFTKPGYRSEAYNNY